MCIIRISELPLEFVLVITHRHLLVDPGTHGQCMGRVTFFFHLFF